MKNILYIQSEKLGTPDYIFVNEELLSEKEKTNHRIEDHIFIKQSDILLKENDDPQTQIWKRLLNGYLFEGVLNEKDEGDRIMTYTCFYNGKSHQIESYLQRCLMQIGKSVNAEHLHIVNGTIRRFKVIRSLLAVLVSAGLIYGLLK